MGIFSFLDPVLDAIFGPLLSLPPTLGLLILSFAVAILTTLVYKYTTNQDLMKQLKDEIKALQAELKQLRDKPEQMMQVQKKAMETNMKYTMQSMRSTLFTILPLILIFGWLQGHLAYDPILPGQEFSASVHVAEGVRGWINATAPEGIEITGDAAKELTDGVAIFTFKAMDAGDYAAPGLTFLVGGKAYNQEVLVTAERAYHAPVVQHGDGVVEFIQVNQQPLKALNLFGWQLGWLGTYIIFSIVFSMGVRKLMKVY